MASLTQEQRIKRAHVWLMGHKSYCLYSGIFLMGESTVEDNVPTAYTDGLNVRYGRAFCAGLTEPELRGLVLHETMHKALRHLTIWQGMYKQNPRAANAACDYVINLIIRDSDPEGKHVKLGEGWLCDERFRGMDSQQVFKLLVQDSEGDKQGGEGDKQDSEGDKQDGDIPDALDEHDWENAAERTGEEEKELAEQIDHALRQGSMLASRKGGDAKGLLADALESQVDWRTVLAEFATTTTSGKDISTWRRPSRRWIGQGIYMPSSISESVGRIVIAVDGSWSVISGHELGVFLGEMRGICESVCPESVDVIYWSDRVMSHEIYDTDSLSGILTTTRPMGGGGTVLACVPEYLRAKRIEPEFVVVLTDGEIYGRDGWGVWNHPLLVCCTTNIVAPVGKTVRVRL